MYLCDVALEVFSDDDSFRIRQFGMTAIAKLTRSVFVDRNYSAISLQLRLKSFDGARLTFSDNTGVLIAPISEADNRLLAMSRCERVADVAQLFLAESESLEFQMPDSSAGIKL